MGFWNRFLGTSGAEHNDNAAGGILFPRHRRRHHPAHTSSCDPRLAAQVLHMGLDRAAAFGFTPIRDITIDDIDFDYYGGPQGFQAEFLTALLSLDDEDGAPLFPRVFLFDPEYIQSNDSYATLLRSIAQAATTDAAFSDVQCDLHFGPDFQDNPVGELHYRHHDNDVQLDVAVEGEWVDIDVARQLFIHATPEGHQWLSNHDFTLHIWVPENHAEEVARILSEEDTAADTRLAHETHPGLDST